MPALNGVSNPGRGDLTSFASIRLARLTSAEGPLTKVFSLDKQGELHKRTLATLWNGRVENLDLADFDAFLKVLPTLQSNQALTYGVSLLGDGLIYPESLKIWKKFESDVPGALCAGGQSSCSSGINNKNKGIQ